jgi:hypothetical protein
MAKKAEETGEETAKGWQALFDYVAENPETADPWLSITLPQLEEIVKGEGDVVVSFIAEGRLDNPFGLVSRRGKKWFMSEAVFDGGVPALANPEDVGDELEDETVETWIGEITENPSILLMPHEDYHRFFSKPGEETDAPNDEPGAEARRLQGEEGMEQATEFSDEEIEHLKLGMEEVSLKNDDNAGDLNAKELNRQRRLTKVVLAKLGG